MARSVIMSGGVNPATSTANTTQYWYMIGYPDRNSASGDAEMPIFKSGTLSNLRVQLAANTVNNTTVFTLMIDGVAVNEAMSVATNTTGTFEDTTNSDSITGGSDICLRSVPAGGSTGTFQVSYTSIIYEGTDAATVTTSFFGVSRPTGRSYTTASTTSFFELNGYHDVANTTEANSQYEMRVSGTFKKLSTYIPTNGRTTTTTISLRKGAVSQSLAVSVGNVATGWFEDTTNTVSVVANDLVNWRITTGTGTQSIVIYRVNCEFEFTGSTQMVLAHNQVHVATARNITRYCGFTGYFDIIQTFNDNYRFDLPLNATASKSGIRVSANAIASASTFVLQKNGVDTALSISIGSTTTGWLEDTTNSVALVRGDLLNFRLTTGTGSGSQTITLRSYGVHLDIADAPITATSDAKAIMVSRVVSKN
jgi:hypothetical protein